MTRARPSVLLQSLALLALAASQAEARDVVLVLDRSRSVAASGDDPGRVLCLAALALADGRPGDRLYVIAPGAGVDLGPHEAGTWAGALATLQAPAQADSDLLAALEQANDLLRERGGVCVLVSDGELDVVRSSGQLPDDLTARLGEAASGNRVTINRAARQLLADEVLPQLTRGEKSLVFVQLPLDPQARFAPLDEVLPEQGKVVVVEPASLGLALSEMVRALDPRLLVVEPQGGGLSFPEFPGLSDPRVALLQANTFSIVDPSAAAQAPEGGSALGVYRTSLSLDAQSWWSADGAKTLVVARGWLGAGGAAVDPGALPWPVHFELSLDGAAVATSEKAPFALQAELNGAAGALVDKNATVKAYATLDGRTIELARADCPVGERAPVALEASAVARPGARLSLVAKLPAERSWAQTVHLVLEDAQGKAPEVRATMTADDDCGLSLELASGLPQGVYKIAAESGLLVGVRFAWGEGASLNAGGLVVSVPPELRLFDAEGAPLTGEQRLTLAAGPDGKLQAALALSAKLEPAFGEAPSISATGSTPGSTLAVQLTGGGGGAKADGAPLQLVVTSPPAASEQRLVVEVTAADAAKSASIDLVLLPRPGPPYGLIGGIAAAALLLTLLLWYLFTPSLADQQLRQVGRDGRLLDPAKVHYLRDHRPPGRTVSLPLSDPPFVLGLSGGGVTAKPYAGAELRVGDAVGGLDAGALLQDRAVALVGQVPWVYFERDPGAELGVWWPPFLDDRQARKLDPAGRLTDTAHYLRDCCALGETPGVPLATPPLTIRVSASAGAEACTHPAVWIEGEGGAIVGLISQERPLAHGTVLHSGEQVWVYLERDPTEAERARAWTQEDEMLVLEEKTEGEPGDDDEDMVLYEETDEGEGSSAEGTS